MSAPGTVERPLCVAVIGSGPSGFYAAEALLKAPNVTVRVDVFDRVPTPFGLVRGGVAPDHQKVKAVTATYEHPDHRHHHFDLSCEAVAIVGVGNVAMDVARILTQDAELLAKTDAASYAVEALRNTTPRLLAAKGVKSVDFAQWKRLDGIELARGVEHGKVREKFTRVEDMLAALCMDQCFGGDRDTMRSNNRQNRRNHARSVKPPLVR
jgi:NADPH-dependent glutamate synthase beta subunit-like oxidoreductase